MARRLMVVAGVLERDGRLLICQRRNGDRHALKWEFPGGKVEDGETPAEALKRELCEELGIRAAEGHEIVRYEYRYPRGKPLLLLFHRVTGFEGEPVNGVFEKIVWELPERLHTYDFLDGDRDFIKRLARGEL